MAGARRRRGGSYGGSIGTIVVRNGVDFIRYMMTHHAGPSLFICYIICAMAEWWRVAMAVAIFWVVYVLFMADNRCRVETNVRRPCSIGVSGIQGTCKYHPGRKVGLPVKTAAGWMWPRRELDAISPELAFPEATARDTRNKDALDWALPQFVVAVASLLFSVVATWRGW